MSRFSRSAVTAGLLMIIGVVFALEFLSGAIWDDTILRQFGAIEHGLLQSGEYWRLLAAMSPYAGPRRLPRFGRGGLLPPMPDA